MKPRTVNRLSLVLLFGPICIFYWKVIFLWELPNGGDLLAQFIPWRMYAIGCLKNGLLPLWNPYTFCGTPFWANIQTSLLFPWNVLHLILEVPIFFAYCLVIHHLIAAGAMFAYFKSRYHDPISALVAGTIYAWTGFFMLHADDGHWIHIQAYAYIPLCLLAQDRLREGFTWLRLTGLVIPLAMMILAGHTQLPLYVCYLLIFRDLWYFFARKEHLRIKSRQMAATLGGIAISLLICAAVLIPLLELSAHSSTRAGGMSYESATHDSLPPIHIATLLAPFLFGDPNYTAPERKFWETTIGYHEICGYAGVASLVLVFLAFVPVRRKEKDEHGRTQTNTDKERTGESPDAGKSEENDLVLRNERHFALTLLILSIILALGKYTPLYHVLYTILPGFAYFRVPARLLLFYGFAVAILAGLGMRRLMLGPWWSRRHGLSVMLMTGLGLLLLGLTGLAYIIQDDIWSYLHYIEAERSRIGLDLPVEALREINEEIPKSLTEGRLQSLLKGMTLTVVWFWSALLGAVAMHRWGARHSWLALLVWGVILGDMVWFAHRFIPTSPWEQWRQHYYRTIDFLDLPQNDLTGYRILFTDEVILGPTVKGHLECRPNKLMVRGIKTVRGYDPIQLASFAAFVNEMQGRDPGYRQGGMLHITFPSLIRPVAYQLTAVKYLVTTMEAPSMFELVWEDSLSPLRMYKNPDARPEMQLFEGSGGSILVNMQHPTLLDTSVETPRDTTFFWSQCYYPGWHVFVDGVEQPIKSFLNVFMQVPVPAGNHRVVFQFKPLTVYRGIAISVLSAVVLTILCLIDTWRRRRFHGTDG